MEGRKLPALRTASKTVRKFTHDFGENPRPAVISVALDWLSFMCDCPNLHPPGEKEAARVYGDLVLEYQQKGTPTFNYMWRIYYHGEPVANLMSHSKNEKIIKGGTCKVEILNNVLYSTDLREVYDTIMFELQLQIRNLTRIDIAIDGNNYLYPFLNAYAKQTSRRTARIRMKGKARFDAKVMNKDFLYQNFKIGNGHKNITVYNKSQEIDGRSHKEYIRALWEKNGLRPDETPIWRCELRLGSQGVKTYKDLDLFRAMIDPNYLLSVFRTAIENFFEFVLIDRDQNISRGRKIDLFDFGLLQVNLLEKVPRAKVDGAYKAKMGIHQDVKSLLLGYIGTDEDQWAALMNIRRNIELFDLRRYYTKKLPEWVDSYGVLMRKKDKGIKALLESVNSN